MGCGILIGVYFRAITKYVPACFEKRSGVVLARGPGINVFV